MPGRLGEERFAVEDGEEPVPVQTLAADDRAERLGAIQRPRLDAVEEQNAAPRGEDDGMRNANRQPPCC